jgi:DNA-binding PadR family transcriptional regulator
MEDQELTPLALEILLSLASGPRHGYAVKLDIEERGGEGTVLGSGSLYQSIQRLERRGLIAEHRTQPPSTDARRGRTYRIEPSGRRALRRELARMGRVLADARAARLVERESH